MRLILVVVAILTSGQATALSCLRPDAVRLFEHARDAEAAFYIVKGRMNFLEEPNLPVRGSEVPAQTRVQIEGEALTRSGFEFPFLREVSVETFCLSRWCGQLDGLEGRFIMAIETEGDDLTLRVGPCGGDLVRWDVSGERRLLECHLKGTCKTADF